LHIIKCNQRNKLFERNRIDVTNNIYHLNKHASLVNKKENRIDR